MADLRDLDRRLSRHLELGRGIRLSVEELDLLVDTGAYEAIRAAATRMQRDQCRSRAARTRSIDGDPSPSTADPTAETSKSSGMTPTQDAKEALRHARLISGRGG